MNKIRWKYIYRVFRFFSTKIINLIQIDRIIYRYIVVKKYKSENDWINRFVTIIKRLIDGDEL